MSGKNQLQKVIDMNQKTEKFGLALTEEEAKLLVERRQENLREQQRVEFGEGILPKLIFTFAIRLIFIRKIMWRQSPDCRRFFIYTKMSLWMN